MQLAYSRAALHLSWQRLADLGPDGRLSAQLERNRRPPDMGDTGKSPALAAGCLDDAVVAPPASGIALELARLQRREHHGHGAESPTKHGTGAGLAHSASTRARYQAALLLASRYSYP